MLARLFNPVLATLLFGWLGFLIAFEINSNAGGGSRASNQSMEWVYGVTDVIGSVPTGIIIAALGPIVGYLLWRKSEAQAAE